MKHSLTLLLTILTTIILTYIVYASGYESGRVSAKNDSMKLMWVENEKDLYKLKYDECNSYVINFMRYKSN